MRFLIATFLLNLSLVGFGQAQNLHLIDQAPNGFALYRSGRPTPEDFKKWCELGITEVLVLSGDAHHTEYTMQNHCPSIRVVENVRQLPDRPVSKEFLNLFDNWVQEARSSGKKILFRCQCGCHRTGRLAAYYEMKFMKAPRALALENLNKLGREMVHHPYLLPQIEALEAFSTGAECPFERTPDAARYCVQR